MMTFTDAVFSGSTLTHQTLTTGTFCGGTDSLIQALMPGVSISIEQGTTPGILTGKHTHHCMVVRQSSGDRDDRGTRKGSA
jgi:hypothetical protein